MNALTSDVSAEQTWTKGTRLNRLIETERNVIFKVIRQV